MTKPPTQDTEVKEFFNRISDKYSDKYSEKNPFHQWYFNERLDAATGLGRTDFSDKYILDIGTGTGALYDFLQSKQFHNMHFYGCDIAEKMLRESNIPIRQQFVGHCYDIDFKVDTFDYIFVLGVTTYLDPEERDQMLRWIREHISKDGTILLSFTNKYSLNNFFYLLAKPFMRLFRGRNRVATQTFRTYNYSQRVIRRLLKDNFHIEQLIYINQTFFPFSHLFPGLSIRFARFIKRHRKASRLFNLLSAEFLVVMKPGSGAPQQPAS